MRSCCDEYCSTHGCNQGRDCPVRIERIREAKRRLDAGERRSYQFITMLLIVAVVSIIGWIFYESFKVTT